MFVDCFDSGPPKLFAHAHMLAHAQNWCGAARVPGANLTAVPRVAEQQHCTACVPKWDMYSDQ